MKKISCVGYHATGSGAIDDFLREFDNIESARYGIECRFLQDPDGISDLEYNLVDNPHRLNSGYALKRFLLFAQDEKRTYHHIFGDMWMKWAKEYVDELKKFSYRGYWHADLRIISNWKLFIYKVRRVVNLFMPSKIKKNKYYNYFPNIETYCVDISEEEFLRVTRKKCDELCSLLNINNKEYVVLDQVVSPQNIDRYLRYISDLQIIVVDRDPRDVFLNDVVKNKDYVLPKNVLEFCEVYRISRKQNREKCNTHNVLHINFEDMIYRYDETCAQIMEFLGLDESNHVWKGQFFKPEISRKNTRIWENRPEYEQVANQIAEILPDYLYITE